MWLLETLCLLFSIFQIKSHFKTNRRFGLAKKHILWTTVSCYDVFAKLCVTWPDLKQGLKMKACWFPGALRLYPKFLIMASTLETPTIPTSSPSLSHLPHCPKSKPHFTDLALCKSVRLLGQSTPYLLPSKILAQWSSMIPSLILSSSYLVLFPWYSHNAHSILAMKLQPGYFSLNPQHVARYLAHSKYLMKVVGAWEYIYIMLEIF